MNLAKIMKVPGIVWSAQLGLAWLFLPGFGAAVTFNDLRTGIASAIVLMICLLLSIGLFQRSKIARAMVSLYLFGVGCMGTYGTLSMLYPFQKSDYVEWTVFGMFTMFFVYLVYVSFALFFTKEAREYFIAKSIGNE
jgi:hypothetical protein